jgi:hypothetical protein
MMLYRIPGKKVDDTVIVDKVRYDDQTNIALYDVHTTSTPTQSFRWIPRECMILELLLERVVMTIFSFPRKSILIFTSSLPLRAPSLLLDVAPICHIDKL